MARKHRAIEASGYTIALVDDDPDYLEATRLLLESEGHTVFTACDGEVALKLLRQHTVDLLLLDYFMPKMTGEQVVEELRTFDTSTQVILQTGYANERPPREMLRRLDIQGYYDKSEGPDRLLLWTDAGLKAADAIGRLARSRKGLREILEVAPSLHRIQPLADLYEDVLVHTAQLVNAHKSVLAVFRDLMAPDIHFGSGEKTAGAPGDDTLLTVTLTGEPSGVTSTKYGGVPESISEEVLLALKSGQAIRRAQETVIPLRVGDVVLGGLWLAHPPLREETQELLLLFANQATVAIQNMLLYEMAALDPLTGVHARRFFETWMRREVRTAFRSQHPVALLLLDMDGLKSINDSAGHWTGDQALAAVGKVLRQATRENDVVGRFGGDEFAVVFPQTDAEGARRVADRLLAMLKETTISGPKGTIPLSASLGLATLPSYAPSDAGFERPISVAYFQGMSEALLQSADDALYIAKTSGKSRLCTAEAINWRAISPPNS
jgi:two-component system, cell cycle response regulator